MIAWIGAWFIVAVLLLIAWSIFQKKIESEHYLNSPEDEIEQRRRM